jgi:glycosyltransferase involved in cell wall biosynthesis
MIGQRGLPATYGGIERHVEELSLRLAARGHEVVVFCRRSYIGDSSALVDGIRLAYPPTIASKHLEAFIHSGIASALTVGGGFDIVHFHAIGPGLWSPIPRWLSGSKVVQTIHGLDQDRAKWSRPARTVLRLGDHMSQRVPDAVIVVGEYLLDHYRARRGLTLHVPNGVALTPVTDESILGALGLLPRGYALFVGRLTPEKAVDQLIQAFARVETPMRLVVVGGSSFTDGYERRIRDLASRDPRVVLPGYVYGKELAALYSNAALYVQPSLLEGIPLTVLEAAAYGLPLVLSDIPAHLELLPATRPGGRLFSAGSEPGLAEALLQGILAAASELSVAQAAAEEIIRRFSWDAVADQTEAVYEELLT